VIGIDTNVLVRYFAQDDPEQAPQANALLDQLTESEPGYITTVVLVETYWVLRHSYKTDRPATAAVLRGLVESREIVVEQPDLVRRALRRVDHGADFADALSYEAGVDAGCTCTVTFDHDAVKYAGMELVDSARS
jgi:predicted nucleic-acid-binding protein